MSTSREHVKLSGRLSGQGLNAECIVSAIKLRLRPDGPSDFARYSVESVSKTLPEGNYELAIANGKTLLVCQHRGQWLQRRLKL
jgi:hypothetical protein